MEMIAPQTFVRIIQGAEEDGLQVFPFKGMEDKDPATGKQRGRDVKRGIFGGGANEGEKAGFHMGKEGILLAFVETMDLIDKKNSSPVFCLQKFLGLFHDLPDFFYPGEDG